MTTPKAENLHRLRRSSTSAPPPTSSTIPTQNATSEASANLILPRHLTGLFVRPASYYLQPKMTTYYTSWGQSFAMPSVDTPRYGDVNSAAIESTDLLASNQHDINFSFAFHPYSPFGPAQAQFVQNQVDGEDVQNRPGSISGTEISYASDLALGEGEDYFDGATLHDSPTGNHGDPACLGCALPVAEDCNQELSTTLASYQSSSQQEQPETYSGVPLSELRNFYDLHGIAKQLPPKRLNNALYGLYIDITEDESERVFLHHVPKKMLILFIGRQRVSRYLKTLSEHDKSEQVLRLPPGSTSHVGLKILIAWMTRACKKETMFSIEPIRIPKHLFAAISLARTLDLFGLYRDRDRVDHFLNAHHFRRPLLIDSIKEVWKLLPEVSKYTFRMIKQLSESLEANERGLGKELPDKEEILAFVEENPALKSRVLDQTENKMWIPDLTRFARVKKEDTKRLRQTEEEMEMETEMEAKTSEWKQYQQRKKTPPVLNIVFKDT